MKTYKCVICKLVFEGFGNNPSPLKEKGRCCDECNCDVIVARCKSIGINIPREQIEQVEKMGRDFISNKMN